MRAWEAVREGWRDVVSGAAGAVVLALVFGVAVSAVVDLRAAGVAAVVREAHGFVAAGAATTIVQADGRIDGRACDALATIPSVLASGALRSVDHGAVPNSLPRTALPTYDVTRGFPTVVARGAPGGSSRTGSVGVIASAELAEELGLRAGSLLATDTGDTPVASVYQYPDDGRDPDLGYALLSPSIDDGRPYDACWATIWPEDASAVTAARRTVLPSTGAEGEQRVMTGQLNPRLGATFDPDEAIDHQSSALLALTVGLTVGWVALVRRRLSIASDRHVGVTVGAQVVGMVVQHLTWATVGAIGTLAVAIVLLRGFGGPDAVPILIEAACSAALGVVGAVLGGAVGLVTIRERSLHRYFRTR